MNTLLSNTKIQIAPFELFNPFDPELTLPANSPYTLDMVLPDMLKKPRHSLGGLRNYDVGSGKYAMSVNYYNHTGSDLVIEEANGLTAYLPNTPCAGQAEQGWLYVSLVTKATLLDIVKEKLRDKELPPHLEHLVALRDVAVQRGDERNLVNRYTKRESDGTVVSCLEFRISSTALHVPCYFKPTNTVISPHVEDGVYNNHPTNHHRRVQAAISAVPNTIEPEIEKLDGYFEVVKIVDNKNVLASKYYIEREDKVYPIAVNTQCESIVEDGVWIITSGAVTDGEMEPTATVRRYDFNECVYDRTDINRDYPIRIYDKYDTARLRKARENEMRERDIKEREERIKESELKFAEMKAQLEQREKEAEHKQKMTQLNVKSTTEELKVWPALFAAAGAVIAFGLKFLL